MSRALLVLWNDRMRERACDWIRKAPKETRVVFTGPKRTLGQNDKLWACLTDVANQLPWHGQKLHADDWKLLFLDALKREVHAVPSLDGTGFVNLGRSSSNLSIEEMRDLIELIHAFGAQHGVRFNEPNGENYA
jgi:hypothetical protein